VRQFTSKKKTRLLDAANLVEGKTTDKALAGVASAAADAAASRTRKSRTYSAKAKKLALL